MRIFFLLGFFLYCSTAIAAESANTLMKKLDTQTTTLMEKMDGNQALQFQQIRLAFTSLRAVNDVRETLVRAHNACTQAHPDMTNSFADRLDNWENTISEPLNRAQTRLDEMIDRQGFAQPSAVRKYLKLLGRVMTAQKNATPEIPISDADSCAGLMDKMVKSGEVIRSSLTDTLHLDMPLRSVP